MRTETFASEKVVKYINENYIAVWFNHGTGTPNVSGPQYSPAQKKVYPEGGGRGILRTFFVATDGTVLSEIQGYWRPERFLDEAKWSLTLKKDTYKKLHQERAKELTDKASKLTKDNPVEMRKPIVESKLRKKVAALNLLASWHSYSRSQAFLPIGKFLAQIRSWQSQRGIIK